MAVPASKPKWQPWHPARHDQADHHAIRALAVGSATPDQQMRALNWIIVRACMTYEEIFIEGHPEATANMAGRRSAGLQIAKLINLNPEVLKPREGATVKGRRT